MHGFLPSGSILTKCLQTMRVMGWHFGRRKAGDSIRSLHLGLWDSQLSTAPQQPLAHMALPPSALDDVGPDTERSLSEDAGFPVAFETLDTVSLSSEDDCVILTPPASSDVLDIPDQEDDADSVQRLQLRVHCGGATQPAVDNKTVAAPHTIVEETRPRTALQVSGRPIPTPCLAQVRRPEPFPCLSQSRTRDDGGVELQAPVSVWSECRACRCMCAYSGRQSHFSCCQK